MLEARVATSIHEIGAQAWDACFPGRLEGFDYLAAVEAAGLAGFRWRYVLISEAGRPLAAAPGFFTDYSLDTTLTDAGRRLVAATRRLVPRAFTLSLASLGSPCTENVCLGTAPGAARRGELIAALLTAFEGEAAEAGCWLLALKDAPSDDGELREAALGLGYQPTPGMPAAELDIDFADIDGYLARLSYGTRKDLRRKLRRAGQIRVEIRRDLDGLEDRALDLYGQTRARSDLQFEDLTAAYFTGVLARLGERAICPCYFLGDELIGFNLLLQDGETLLDKFFCMETERGPAHDLYFVSWLTNVRLCAERGLKRYRSGQAGYATKLRLGSRLVGAEMLFRHRRPLVNRALRLAAPWLADDPVPTRGAA
ncbi:MAG: GNAT family N-acetyltransferase [Caulobacterales bacterium]